MTMTWTDSHSGLCGTCGQSRWAHGQGVYCPPDHETARRMELEVGSKALRGFPVPPRYVLLEAARLLERIARETEAARPRSIVVTT